MQPIKKITSRTVVMPAANIDTDQIYPARFLTTTAKGGLSKLLFADLRYLKDGSLNPNFVLNKPDARGVQIPVAGPNFGCGSLREHAPWSLLDYGFRAIVSTEIADIFRGNCLKNGLLPVVVDIPTSSWMIAHPGAEVTVDLESSVVRLPTGTNAHFEIDSFARRCLIHGMDELAFLRSKFVDIENYESTQGKCAA
jgi:3-isopropylmalate/(R)-2-methylmalate dehydratase small subunit